MSNDNLGMGVMIRLLCGNEDSVNTFKSGLNKIIRELTLGDDDALHFVFDDGYKMRLSDEGQSCCEHRYMRTDDNLDDFLGATLVDAEVKDGPEIESEWEIHDTQFLVVTTSKGVFTMTTHNEHNGYYGGFSIRAAVE